jgi:HEAT repeat protein
LFLIPALARLPLILQTPEEAYTDFMDTTDQAEDMLMDPLILAGESVVHIVLKEIKSKDMKLRRYAIHFLGNGKFKQAIPVLKTILSDVTEEDYFRSDALGSIFAIDNKLGLVLAKQFMSQDDILGKKANKIVTGKKNWWVQRSFWEALNNVHH